MWYTSNKTPTIMKYNNGNAKAIYTDFENETFLLNSLTYLR